MGSKWFSKIGIALAGIAMAVGVGVGLGQKDFKKAEAWSKGGEFTKVTSVNDIHTGDVVIFVDSTGGHAMGNLNSETNCGAATSNYALDVVVSVSNSKITLAANSTVEEFIVCAGDSSGKFAFQGTSGYLDGNYISYNGTAASSSNYLQRNNVINATSSWTLNYSNNVMSVSLTYKNNNNDVTRYIKYNNSNSSRFACYTSGQTSINIWKKNVAVTGLTVSDGVNSYTQSSNNIDLLEGTEITYTGTVSPNDASNKNVTWQTTGNITGSNGSYTIGAYDSENASNNAATITCTTVGKDSSGNSKSVTLNITITHDARTYTGIKVVDNMTGVSYYTGDSWKTDNLHVYEVYDNGESPDVEISLSNPNLTLNYYTDSERGTEKTAPALGMTSVYIYATYDKDGAGEVYGTETAGVTVHGFTVTQLLVSSLSISGQKKSFTTNDTFSVTGGTITATYNSGNTVELDPTDSNLSYSIENSSKTKLYDLVLGTTQMIAEYGATNRYVQITYNNGQGNDPAKLSSRYSVSVFVAVDYSTGAYYQVTEAPSNWSGDYIVVSSGGKAFNGQDANNGYASGTIDSTNKRIEHVSGMAAIRLTKKDDADTYSVQIAGGNYNVGKYISGTDGSNKLNFGDEAAYCTVSLNDDKTVNILHSETKFWWNISDSRFRFYKDTTTIKDAQGNTKFEIPLIYKWVSNATKVQEFIDNYMHIGDDDFSSTDYVHKCDLVDQESGLSPYTAAKAAFNKLTKAQRELFIDEGGEGETYETAYNRLSAWATANHESFNESTKILGVANNGGLVTVANENNNELLIAIIIIAGISALAIGGYFFIRRKHQ